jgi:hypothetical protein
VKGRHCWPFLLSETQAINRLVTVLVSCLVVLAWQSPARAEAAALHRYELPNLDVLELLVPPAWDSSVDQPEDGGPPTIRLRPREGAPFEVYITPDWPDAHDEAVPDAETLREMVRRAAERIGDQVVEERLEIRRLQGASGVGFYFAATDRQPQPEEFRYLNQGALQVGGLVLRFMILTNDGQDVVVEEAFAMLQSAAHRETGQDRR